MKKSVVGGGCFWCIQAIFLRLKGVHTVKSGYAAGNTQNPSYKQVCSEKTGHAQVCQITYNPLILSYRNLIDIFLKVHDPTTLNRQGNDYGSQYRSIILYQTQQQKKDALQAIKHLQNEKYYKDKIVTEVKNLQKFYPAETYHDNYYNLNREQGYCKAVIKPKLGKLAEYFKDKIDQSKL